MPTPAVAASARSAFSDRWQMTPQLAGRRCHSFSTARGQREQHAARGQPAAAACDARPKSPSTAGAPRLMKPSVNAHFSLRRAPEHDGGSPLISKIKGLEQLRRAEQTTGFKVPWAAPDGRYGDFVMPLTEWRPRRLMGPPKMCGEVMMPNDHASHSASPGMAIDEQGGRPLTGVVKSATASVISRPSSPYC